MRRKVLSARLLMAARCRSPSAGALSQVAPTAPARPRLAHPLVQQHGLLRADHESVGDDRVEVGPRRQTTVRVVDPVPRDLLGPYLKSPAIDGSDHAAGRIEDPDLHRAGRVQGEIDGCLLAKRIRLGWRQRWAFDTPTFHTCRPLGPPE